MLLVRLHMDALEHGSYRTEREIDEFLVLLRGKAEQAHSDEDFTKLLNDAYDRNIARVTKRQNPRDSEKARWILSMIRDARRPMTTSELRTALALRQHGTIEKSTLAWSDISTICQGLVDHDDMQNVRFLHGTLRTYLESPAFNAQGICPDANKDLSAICVQYLTGLEDQVPGQCRDKESLQRRLRDWPFYDYAATHWGDHTRKAWSQQSEIGDSTADVNRARFNNVLALLRDDQKVQAAFQVATIPSHDLHTLSQEIALSSPDLRSSPRVIALGPSPSAFPTEYPYTASGVIGLHVACLYDLVRAVEKLVMDVPQSLEVKDYRQRQALHFAAQGGAAGAVRKLIKFGSNACDTDERGLTPLLLATSLKQDDAVKELCRHEGVDINAASSAFVTRIDEQIPLFPAAKFYGSVGLRTALHMVSRDVNLETVDLFLSMPGIDVNARDSDGQTPYHKAAKKGHLEVVKRLLANSQADPFQTITSPKDHLDGETALHLAAHYPGRGDKVAKHLITKYPRLGTMLSKCGESPLHCAIQSGSLDVVQILLNEKTVDTNIPNNDGMCPSEMVVTAPAWVLTASERFVLFLRVWGHPKTRQSAVDPDNHLASHRDPRFYKIVQNRTEQWDPDPHAETGRPTWRRNMASQKAQKTKLGDFYRNTPRLAWESLDLEIRQFTHIHTRNLLSPNSSTNVK
jgi:ankyrin repeat protein